MSETTETPAATLQAATHENALRQSWVTLLGTVIKPDSASALVRYSGGKIRSVSPGDKLGGGTVMAVEDGLMMLAMGGSTRKLTIPGD